MTLIIIHNLKLRAKKLLINSEGLDTIDFHFTQDHVFVTRGLIRPSQSLNRGYCVLLSEAE